MLADMLHARCRSMYSWWPATPGMGLLTMTVASLAFCKRKKYENGHAKNDLLKTLIRERVIFGPDDIAGVMRVVDTRHIPSLEELLTIAVEAENAGAARSCERALHRRTWWYSTAEGKRQRLHVGAVIEVGDRPWRVTSFEEDEAVRLVSPGRRIRLHRSDPTYTVLESTDDSEDA